MEANEILLGIKENDRQVLDYIYHKYYKSIRFFVIQNSGSDDDARDIFQEAVMIIYTKINNKKLKKFSCAFHTYLFSVSRYLWLQQLQKRGIKLPNDKVKIKEELSTEPDLHLIMEEMHKYELYRFHFRKLSKDCQRILSMFFERNSQKKIANVIGLKNANYAKRKKYLCKERLVKKIKNDPKFKELI